MDAQSVADVKRVMADYLASILPGDRAPLPKSARDALSLDDIEGSALVLTREEVNYVGDQAVVEVLHEIAHTFVAASHRIVAIQGRDKPIGKT